jgi:RimJ/RimL family protein N-acetyltransferase/GNAT superfamily N-acetyltransferase
MKTILETRRLTLREMTPDDLPALWEIVGDDETMYAWNGAWSERENAEGVEKQLRSYRENGFGRWAVVLRDTGRVIGMCGLQWCETDTARVPEIGYLFNRAFWHNGYAAEAALACKRYAFGVLGLREVYSLVRDNNFASMNVAIRAGMTVRGRFSKHYRGVDMPHYIFSVRASDEGELDAGERVADIGGGVKIVSVRGNPEYLDRAADYLAAAWRVPRAVYRECIESSLTTSSPLPRWYVLESGAGDVIGSYGLIVNDFMSRQDLWPWLCALHVSEGSRGNAYGAKMLAHAASEAARLGFERLYLCTDHVGYYEKYGWRYKCDGLNLSGEATRVYERDV